MSSFSFRIIYAAPAFQHVKTINPGNVFFIDTIQETLFNTLKRLDCPKIPWHYNRICFLISITRSRNMLSSWILEWLHIVLKTVYQVKCTLENHYYNSLKSNAISYNMRFANLTEYQDFICDVSLSHSKTLKHSVEVVNVMWLSWITFISYPYKWLSQFE